MKRDWSPRNHLEMTAAALLRASAEDGGNGGEGTVNRRAVHVVVRDHADRGFPGRAAEDSVFRECRTDIRGSAS
jgi:hypothetical protein